MLRLWFLILCVLAGAFAPSRAPAREFENRTRDFFAFSPKTHQETESQAVEPQQEKSAHGYEIASGYPQQAENAGHDIALGFRNLYSKNGQLSQKTIGHSVESLAPFARKTGSRPYWEWGDLNPDLVGMRRGVVGAANRAVESGGKIRFNLDGFRNKGTAIRDAVLRGKSGTGKITEHELYWILRDSKLRDNTVFYRGGRAVESPESLFGSAWNIE